MFKVPEMPFNLPSIDLPSITLPAVDFPSIDFSRLDISVLRNVTLPKVDLPAVDTAKVTAAVRDAAYVAIGLGAVAVERAQARGGEWSAVVNDRLAEMRELIRSAI